MRLRIQILLMFMLGFVPLMAQLVSNSFDQSPFPSNSHALTATAFSTLTPIATLSRGSAGSFVAAGASQVPLIDTGSYDQPDPADDWSLDAPLSTLVIAWRSFDVSVQAILVSGKPVTPASGSLLGLSCQFTT